MTNPTRSLADLIATVEVVVHATGADGNPLDDIPAIVLPLADAVAHGCHPDGARQLLLDLTGDQSDDMAAFNRCDDAVAELRDALVAARADVAAFDTALAALGGTRMVTWLTLDGDVAALRTAVLAATADQVAELVRPVASPAPSPATAGLHARDAAIDAVKRIYGVSKPVAATIVDDGRFDHDRLPADADPSEVAEVVAAAGAAGNDPEALAVLLTAASRGRVQVTDPLVLCDTVGWPLGRFDPADLAAWQRGWSRVDFAAPEPTGLPPAGMGTPMRTARKLLALVQMAPRQHCEACGELLDADNGPGAPSPDRPWCQRCCEDVSLFACGECGRACTHPDVHDNGSDPWCQDCHHGNGWDRDPATVCTRHDNACVRS